MVLGMSLAAFTALHVAIAWWPWRPARSSWWRWPATGARRSSRVYLLTIILTSVTGFMFPPKPIQPAHIFGAVSLVLLAVALLALYGRQLAGRLALDLRRLRGDHLT